jgi:hypothetical protein
MTISNRLLIDVSEHLNGQKSYDVVLAAYKGFVALLSVCLLSTLRCLFPVFTLFPSTGTLYYQTSRIISKPSQEYRKDWTRLLRAIPPTGLTLSGRSHPLRESPEPER